MNHSIQVIERIAAATFSKKSLNHVLFQRVFGTTTFADLFAAFCYQPIFSRQQGAKNDISKTHLILQ